MKTKKLNNNQLAHIVGGVRTPRIIILPLREGSPEKHASLTSQLNIISYSHPEEAAHLRYQLNHGGNMQRIQSRINDISGG
jgi:bacteriocin-like protein